MAGDGVLKFAQLFEPYGRINGRMTAAEKFRNLLATDERYDAEAYNFIYEALDWTLKKVSKKDGRGSQHVTGKELLEGIRRFAAWFVEENK